MGCKVTDFFLQILQYILLETVFQQTVSMPDTQKIVGSGCLIENLLVEMWLHSVTDSNERFYKLFKVNQKFDCFNK